MYKERLYNLIQHTKTQKIRFTRVKNRVSGIMTFVNNDIQTS